MSNEMSCSRWIPTFTLMILLVLPTAAVAGAPAREPADSGRVSRMLESLWQWLDLTFGPSAASVEGRSDTEPPPPENATGTGGGGGGTGGEGTGTYDPTGTGTPPPEYDPDLNPGGTTGTGTTGTGTSGGG